MRGPGARSLLQGIEQLCAQELHHVALQKQSLQLLDAVVPFDIGVQATVDPVTVLDTSCLPLGIEPDPARERQMMRLEYTSDDPLSYAEIAARPQRAGALRLEVDEPRRVRRFTELLEPHGASDELRAAFVADGLCWGTVTLYRTAERPAFTADDVAVLSGISAPMARALRQAFLRAALDHADRLGDPPGHCTVSADGELLTTTETAEHWLQTLGPDTRLPAVVAALTARLARRPTAQATVVGSAGPLTLHAAHAKGTDEAIALIVEKPRPVHLAPLITAAYGFTPRERGVVEGALRGRSTRQLARELGIGEYTVQDHLRAAFSKAGVNSRGELAHVLYIRHYVPSTTAGSTPGPYGYFLDPAAQLQPNGQV